MEQDADMIFSQYIPSKYYTTREDDSDYKTEMIDDSEYKRISETGVLKNRMGDTNMIVREYFYGEKSRYYIDKLENQQQLPAPSDYTQSSQSKDEPF